MSKSSHLLAKVALILAAVLIGSACSMLHPKPKPIASNPTATSSHEARAIRVASSKLMTNPANGQPKVVLSLYEDFLCPICGRFEQTFGPTVSQLVDDGQVAADYYMVAILDSSHSQNYSSRAGGAAYCVADADTASDKPTFRRFHTALYTKQPSETGSTFPTNAELAGTARDAGASDGAQDCIDKGTYTALSAGLGEATNVNATPTVLINGDEYQFSTPDDLVAKVKAITG
jgi:protein-disulfide isomerase